MVVRLRLCLIPLALLGAACSTPRPLVPGTEVWSGPLDERRGPYPHDPQDESAVVLVAIDGVRAVELLHGVDADLARREGFRAAEIIGARALTPNLHALADADALLAGDAVSASGPRFISLPGYMEMLGGRRPTGCRSNSCPGITVDTLIDDFAAISRDPRDVAVITSWEGIGRAATRHPQRVAISVGRTGGATRERLRIDPEASALLDAGAAAGPAPGDGDYRPDEATSALALHHLIRERPRFLFVGLGDTDEYAHAGSYRGYLRALTQADRVVGEIAAALATQARAGRRVTLLVTTDHGRDPGFTGHGTSVASSHVWVVAAGWGIRPVGAVTPTGPRHLADIASTVRLLAGVGHIDPSSQPLLELLSPSIAASAQIAPAPR